MLPRPVAPQPIGKIGADFGMNRIDPGRSLGQRIDRGNKSYHAEVLSLRASKLSIGDAVIIWRKGSRADEVV